MAANSKHFGDVYTWINNMLTNCNDLDQLRNINKIISYYGSMYEDYSYLTSLLSMAYSNKFDKLLRERKA